MSAAADAAKVAKPRTRTRAAACRACCPGSTRARGAPPGSLTATGKCVSVAGVVGCTACCAPPSADASVNTWPRKAGAPGRSDMDRLRNEGVVAASRRGSVPPRGSASATLPAAVGGVVDDAPEDAQAMIVVRESGKRAGRSAARAGKRSATRRQWCAPRGCRLAVWDVAVRCRAQGPAASRAHRGRCRAARADAAKARQSGRGRCRVEQAMEG